MRSNPDRDAVIADLRFNQRLTEREIAGKVGMSAAGVHQAVARLSGKKRRQSRCRGCRKMTTLNQLGGVGLCGECRS